MPTMEEIAVELEGHKHEIKSLKRRMDEVERDQQALLKLTTSVEVMASKQEDISKKVNKIDEKMTVIEEKPLKHWDSLVDKIIWLLAGAAIVALFAQAGIVL